MSMVRELARHRRARGLTQSDLALLVGVTQQAVAKWEQSGSVPHHRVASLAKNLRVPVEVLLPLGEQSSPEHEPRLRAIVNEIFADQILLSFEGGAFHYCPSSEEAREFWRDLQKGSFVLLSAGPVQALVNVDAARRIDFCEDPDLGRYVPLINSDGNDDEAAESWFDHGDARVFVRGVDVPYRAHQSFFSGVLDRSDVTMAELAELHHAFECVRPTENSIFDLFANLTFNADLTPEPSDKNDPTHPSHLNVFQSEDDDGAPQDTWIHTRDILVIEVPTRLWEIHNLGVKAVLEQIERERKLTTKQSRKRSRSKAARI